MQIVCLCLETLTYGTMLGPAEGEVLARSFCSYGEKVNGVTFPYRPCEERLAWLHGCVCCGNLAVLLEALSLLLESRRKKLPRAPSDLLALVSEH